MASTQIDSYEVIYSSNSFSRRISFKKGGAYIGQFVFIPNGNALPADGLNGGQPQLYYHLEDFAIVSIFLEMRNLCFYFIMEAEAQTKTALKPTQS